MNFITKIDKDITLLLDNLPVGIMRFNDTRRCVYANRFIINLFGLNTNQKLDDITSIYVESIHKDDKQNEIETCLKFMSDYQECNSTIRIFNKQLNEYRWMTNRRTVVYPDEETDNTVSFMYTLQDVNENKLLEIQLRNESVRAEQAYNHKSIFLANMSHEIRTPLNGIIGMLTLLEDTKMSNDQLDYVSMIKECSYNLMTIINDILDYSKLEVGKISLDMKPMNLRECIETTNDIILSKIYEKSLEYTYNIDTNLPDCIYGDPNRIKQVLLNLLSNSIKFTDRGNIFVNVDKISDNDYALLRQLNSESSSNIDILFENCLETDNVCVNKIFIRIDITDTGCGIDQKDKDKLFKSFSQVDNHITSKIYQGTGLGLAISKELVELMGGFCWLDWSEPGRGSRFSIVLPTLQSTEMNTTSTNENVLHNANVLIVDDNLHNRISLTAMITKWGMKPHVFSNGEEALHFTKLTKFDIGLIDICMPKMDGPTFSNKLREQKEFNNNTFPLVALSSLGDKLASKCKHFKTHLIKPIKESRLKQICIDLLHKRVVDKSITHKQEYSNKTIPIDNYIDQNNLPELKSNVRVLLAEDVYINQKVVISFLNKLGYDNIQVVDNGQQCLDIAINNQFDVILLDIRMPVMNGEVVLQELNKHYSNSNKRKPYIVAVTAYCLREDKERYLNMGFDDYIPKPITVNDLKNCLDKFIQSILYN
jgi:signal transduction histidine kinase/DNA-binding response OmpR family regulator